MSEKEFLESLVETYSSRCDMSPYSRWMRELLIRTCAPYLNKKHKVLEFGCEVGYMTELIAGHVNRVDVIDGSPSFIKEAKKRKIPNAFFYEMLFENFVGHADYDCAFASHVLEHVVDPQEFLLSVKRGLRCGGYLFLAIPNGTAMSRRLAREMGLLKNNDPFELTENDIKGGHRRVYELNGVVYEVEQAGFNVVDVSGILFKPFADFQMDQLLNDGFLTAAHMEGLYKLGLKHETFCGDILVIARKP